MDAFLNALRESTSDPSSEKIRHFKQPYFVLMNLHINSNVCTEEKQKIQKEKQIHIYSYNPNIHIANILAYLLQDYISFISFCIVSPHPVGIFVKKNGKEELYVYTCDDSSIHYLVPIPPYLL